MVALYKQRGELLPYPDLMDNKGQPTCNPNVIATNPAGSILPLGGMKHGHKGSAISFMVELLTGCLSGRGRAEAFEGWSAACFLLILDPDSFGGREMYRKQADRLAEMVHASVPREGFDRVRLPGERGLERRAHEMRHGIPIPSGLLDNLIVKAAEYGVTMPAAL